MRSFLAVMVNFQQDSFEKQTSKAKVLSLNYNSSNKPLRISVILKNLKSKQNLNFFLMKLEVMNWLTSTLLCMG